MVDVPRFVFSLAYEPAANVPRGGCNDREEVLMSTKRQQTMAKMARERAVKEKRARKAEKKEARLAEREAQLADGTFGIDTEGTTEDEVPTAPDTPVAP